MDLLLSREDVSNIRTIGQLFIGPSLECWTLEPPAPRLAPLCDHPSIPAGRYRILIQRSQHFGCLLPHVLDVPGRSEIEIHWGNTDQDTHGCILVGLTRGADDVLQSKLAFASLQPKLAAAQAMHEDIWLTVVDPPQGASA